MIGYKSFYKDGKRMSVHIKDIKRVEEINDNLTKVTLFDNTTIDVDLNYSDFMMILENEYELLKKEGSKR